MTGSARRTGAPRRAASSAGVTRGTRAQLARAALEASATRRATSSRRCGPTRAARSGSSASTAASRRTTGRWRSQADLLGVPIFRPADVESTALGAAFAAGWQAGVYPGPEVVRGAPPPRPPLHPRHGREDARGALPGLAGGGAAGAVTGRHFRVRFERFQRVAAPFPSRRNSQGRVGSMGSTPVGGELALRVSISRVEDVFTVSVFPPHSNQAKGWRLLSRWTRVLRSHFNRRHGRRLRNGRFRRSVIPPRLISRGSGPDQSAPTRRKNNVRSLARTRFEPILNGRAPALRSCGVCHASLFRATLRFPFFEAEAAVRRRSSARRHPAMGT